MTDYREDRDAEYREFQDKVEAEIKQGSGGRRGIRRRRLRDLQKKAGRQCSDNGEEVGPDLQEEMVGNAARPRRSKINASRIKVDQLKRDEARQQEILDRQLNSNIRHDQNIYKILAVALPPILPFIVGVFVFFSRRAQEREGVAKSRLR